MINYQQLKALKHAYRIAQPICDHKVDPSKPGDMCACTKIYQLLKAEEAKK